MAANADKRLILVLLCVLISPLAGSQTRTAPTRRPVVLQPGLDRVQIGTVPQLTWLQRNEAAVLLRRSGLGANYTGSENGIVISQDPAPGKQVVRGTAVTVTLGEPRLSLEVSSPSAQVGEDLTFTLTLDPPPRSPPRYFFQWDDNTGAEAVEQAVQTHRFAAARSYKISAVAMVGERRVFSNTVVVAITDPTPVTETVEPIPTPDPTTTGVPATDTLTTSSPATDIQTTDIPAQDPPTPSGTAADIPPPDPETPADTTTDRGRFPSILLIALAVVALAGVATFIYLKTRTPSVTTHAPSPLVVRPTLSSISHEIQSSDRIRATPSIRIRAKRSAGA